MKVKLTEAQYRALEQYIEEARQEKPPTSLKALFDDNPEVKFFGVVQRMKAGGDSEYYFELTDQNGHKGVKDINKMGKTKNCVGDLLLDTVLYGNQFKMPFGACGVRTINSVTSINLYASSEDAQSGKVLDSMEIEHDMDATSTELIDKYYELLKNVEVGKEIYIDSKNKWDGIVSRKSSDQIEIELYKHGIPINEADEESDMEWNVQSQNQAKPKQRAKPKKKPVILTLDLRTNPFYEENGTLMLKGKSYDRETEVTADFVVPVKAFDISADQKLAKQKAQSEPKEPEDPKAAQSEEDLRKEAERAYKMILNDPNLKKAFYKKPSFWNLFVSELKGKKAPGKGIYPTLQMIGSYGRGKLNEKLGAEFLQGKRVTFEPYNRPYSIKYGDKTFELGVGTLQTGVVRNFGVADDSYIVDNKQDEFKLFIKDKTEQQDVFKCELVKYTKKANEGIQNFPYQGDVYIRFKKSDGYSPTAVNKPVQPTTSTTK
jgi:hypothetical protein